MFDYVALRWVESSRVELRQFRLVMLRRVSLGSVEVRFVRYVHLFSVMFICVKLWQLR